MSRWAYGCVTAGFAAMALPGLLCAAGIYAWMPSAMPGTASRDLDDLHPEFRVRVERLISRLEDQGYTPEVRETWRDSKRQAYYRRKGWSQARRGFHTRVGDDGLPEALAVDLGHEGLDANRPSDREELARFYRALLESARDEGLTTGATWSKRGRWAPYDLGWDPGHVQPANAEVILALKGRPSR